MSVEELRRLWGKNIRNLRRAHDLTQEQLGDRIGVTRNAVALWEGGLRAPTDHHKRQLAGILRQDVAQLFPLTALEESVA